MPHASPTVPRAGALYLTSPHRVIKLPGPRDDPLLVNHGNAQALASELTAGYIPPNRNPVNPGLEHITASI